MAVQGDRTMNLKLSGRGTPTATTCQVSNQNWQIRN